jgi:hypothetical protein
MAKLRVFVSSTCYDLSILRSELRPFISQMGYEPIMSDYADILYDPRTHTHDSCLKEIPSADVIVLIIGSRFGGLAVPSATLSIDFPSLEKLSSRPGILENKEKLSITQLEVLKAVEQNIPVYAFVEERVMHDHQLYEKNKNKKDIIEQIEFPSIQRRESAKYIFEFINFLGHRVTNNSITSFSRLDDIRAHLTGQWSQMFQRLLMESRTKSREEIRYRDFSESIEDLKAVVLASLTTPDLRETAKGAIQYRRVISFLSYFRVPNIRDLLLSNLTWDELLRKLGIVEILVGEVDDRMGRSETYLVLEDRTFYRLRFSTRILDDYQIDWTTFLRLENHSRAAIVDALLEDREGRRMGMMPIQHIQRSVEEYLSRRTAPINSEQAENAETITLSQALGIKPVANATLAEDTPDAPLP